MNSSVYTQTRSAIAELWEKAKLKPGSIVVIGCSTSEVVGAKIGTNSDPDIAGEIFNALKDFALEKDFFLAVQCCEHLNRAIIIEREAVPGAYVCNAVPQPKAGGSFATAAYAAMRDPVAVERVVADAGMDIGDTLIGMHVRPVVVPCRLSIKSIGEAHLVCARSRAKFIGGERAHYDKDLM